MSKTEDDFYKTQTKQSLIKSLIVKDYFAGWFSIINHRYKGDYLYLDLFSGPGSYDDGNISTPMYIANEINKNQKMLDKIYLHFNDYKVKYISKLKDNITTQFNPNFINDRISFTNLTINEQTIQFFKKIIRGRSTLLFYDPFGYKVVSIKTLNELITNFGSDCIFFFNYSRLNRAINNPKTEHLISPFFGNTNGLERLRSLLRNKDSFSRQELILNDLYESFLIKGCYTTKFKIYNDKNALSHCIIIVSHHPSGLDLAKKTFFKHSSDDSNEVKMFEYHPDKRGKFNYEHSIQLLKDRILKNSVEYDGLKTTSLYKKDHIQTEYILNHYKKAL